MLAADDDDFFSDAQPHLTEFSLDNSSSKSGNINNEDAMDDEDSIDSRKDEDKGNLKDDDDFIAAISAIKKAPAPPGGFAVPFPTSNVSTSNGIGASGTGTAAGTGPRPSFLTDNFSSSLSSNKPSFLSDAPSRSHNGPVIAASSTAVSQLPSFLNTNAAKAPALGLDMSPISKQSNQNNEFSGNKNMISSTGDEDASGDKKKIYNDEEDDGNSKSKFPSGGSSTTKQTDSGMGDSNYEDEYEDEDDDDDRSDDENEKSKRNTTAANTFKPPIFTSTKTPQTIQSTNAKSTESSNTSTNHTINNRKKAADINEDSDSSDEDSDSSGDESESDDHEEGDDDDDDDDGSDGSDNENHKQNKNGNSNNSSPMKNDLLNKSKGDIKNESYEEDEEEEVDDEDSAKEKDDDDESNSYYEEPVDDDSDDHETSHSHQKAGMTSEKSNRSQQKQSRDQYDSFEKFSNDSIAEDIPLAIQGSTGSIDSIMIESGVSGIRASTNQAKSNSNKRSEKTSVSTNDDFSLTGNSRNNAGTGSVFKPPMASLNSNHSTNNKPSTVISIPLTTTKRVSSQFSPTNTNSATAELGTYTMDMIQSESLPPASSSRSSSRGNNNKQSNSSHVVHTVAKAKSTVVPENSKTLTVFKQDKQQQNHLKQEANRPSIPGMQSLSPRQLHRSSDILPGPGPKNATSKSFSQLSLHMPEKEIKHSRSQSTTNISESVTKSRTALEAKKKKKKRTKIVVEQASPTKVGIDLDEYIRVYNLVGELELECKRLKEENRTLHMVEKRQEKAIKQMDNQEQDYPRVIHQLMEEMRILREKSKGNSEKLLESEKKLKVKHAENVDLREKIDKLQRTIKQFHYDKTQALTERVATLEEQLQKKQEEIDELHKREDLHDKAKERELKELKTKNKDYRSHLDEVLEELDRLRVAYREKEKLLNKGNIYAIRIGREQQVDASTMTDPDSLGLIAHHPYHQHSSSQTASIAPSASSSPQHRNVSSLERKHDDFSQSLQAAADANVNAISSDASTSPLSKQQTLQTITSAMGQLQTASAAEYAVVNHESSTSIVDPRPILHTSSVMANSVVSAVMTKNPQNASSLQSEAAPAPEPVASYLSHKDSAIVQTTQPQENISGSSSLSQTSDQNTPTSGTANAKPMQLHLMHSTHTQPPIPLATAEQRGASNISSEASERKNVPLTSDSHSTHPNYTASAPVVTSAGMPTTASLTSASTAPGPTAAVTSTTLTAPVRSNENISSHLNNIQPLITKPVTSNVPMTVDPINISGHKLKREEETVPLSPTKTAGVTINAITNNATGSLTLQGATIASSSSSSSNTSSDPFSGLNSTSSSSSSTNGGNGNSFKPNMFKPSTSSLKPNFMMKGNTNSSASTYEGSSNSNTFNSNNNNNSNNSNNNNSSSSSSSTFNSNNISSIADSSSSSDPASKSKSVSNPVTTSNSGDDIDEDIETSNMDDGDSRPTSALILSSNQNATNKTIKLDSSTSVSNSYKSTNGSNGTISQPLTGQNQNQKSDTSKKPIAPAEEVKPQIASHPRVGARGAMGSMMSSFNAGDNSQDNDGYVPSFVSKPAKLGGFSGGSTEKLATKKDSHENSSQIKINLNSNSVSSSGPKFPWDIKSDQNKSTTKVVVGGEESSSQTAGQSIKKKLPWETTSSSESLRGSTSSLHASNSGGSSNGGTSDWKKNSSETLQNSTATSTSLSNKANSNGGKFPWDLAGNSSSTAVDARRSEGDASTTNASTARRFPWENTAAAPKTTAAFGASSSSSSTTNFGPSFASNSSSSFNNNSSGFKGFSAVSNNSSTNKQPRSTISDESLDDGLDEEVMPEGERKQSRIKNF